MQRQVQLWSGGWAPRHTIALSSGPGFASRPRTFFCSRPSSIPCTRPRLTPQSRSTRYQRIVRTPRLAGYPSLIRRKLVSADFVEKVRHGSMLSPPPSTPRGRRKPSTTTLAALFVSAADHALFLLFLHGRRRYQVQNQGHRTSGIDVHRPRSEPPVGRQSLPSGMSAISDSLENHDRFKSESGRGGHLIGSVLEPKPKTPFWSAHRRGVWSAERISLLAVSSGG